MYLHVTGTENAKKLPLDQDAWMLMQFGNHELVRIHLDPEQAIAVEAGRHRFWSNTGKEVLDTCH